MEAKVGAILGLEMTPEREKTNRITILECVASLILDAPDERLRKAIARNGRP